MIASMSYLARFLLMLNTESNIIGELESDRGTGSLSHSAVGNSNVGVNARRQFLGRPQGQRGSELYNKAIALKSLRGVE